MKMSRMEKVVGKERRKMNRSIWKGEGEEEDDERKWGVRGDSEIRGAQEKNNTKYKKEKTRQLIVFTWNVKKEITP